jgi:hypothetical protein
MQETGGTGGEAGTNGHGVFDGRKAKSWILAELAGHAGVDAAC